VNQFYYNVCGAFHVTIKYTGFGFWPILARSRPGILNCQPDPLGEIPGVVRSRLGLSQFSLVPRPFTAEYQLALDEIGPVTRNPERDTERTRVVLARNPSLLQVFCPY